MWRCVILILLAVVSLQPLGSSAQQPDSSEGTFTSLQHQWAEARKHADVAFLEQFYAKEFTVGLMDGGEATRAQDLAMFSSGDLKPAVIEDSEMRVATYGQTAMVTGVEHLAGTYKGHSGQYDVRFTNLYVFRDGRWQMVRHQAAQIRKP